MSSGYNLMLNRTREEMFQNIPSWPAPNAVASSSKMIQTVYPDMTSELLESVLNLNNPHVGDLLKNIRIDFIKKWEEFTKTIPIQLEEWNFPSDAGFLSATKGLFDKEQSIRNNAMKVIDKFQLMQMHNRSKIDKKVKDMVDYVEKSLQILNSKLNDPIVKAWIQYQEKMGSQASVLENSEIWQVSAVAGRTVYIAADYLINLKAASLDLKYLTIFQSDFNLALSNFYARLFPPNEQEFNESWVDLCSSLKALKMKWSFIRERDDFHVNYYVSCVDTGNYGMVEGNSFFRTTASTSPSPEILGKRVLQLDRREYDRVLLGLDFLNFRQVAYLGVRGRGIIESGILTLSMERLANFIWLNSGISYLPLYSSPTKLSNIFSTNMDLGKIMDLPAADYMYQRIKTVTWTLPSPIDPADYEVVAWLTAIEVNTAAIIRVKTWPNIKSPTEVELNAMTWYDSRTWSVSIGACLMPRRSPDCKMRCGKMFFNVPNQVSARTWFIAFDPPFPGGHTGEIKVMTAFGDVDLGFPVWENEIAGKLDSRPENIAFIRLCTTGISDSGFYLHFGKHFKSVVHLLSVTWVAALQ
ncbi:hypothetical protein TWF694_002612 [Orbilia ellipsospora]|uniref:Uncharacterized protein n=1 Tax=Orbilia ellipsospora TaxID=2528407 RepID=A0AAV9X3M2_9PEZI